MFYNEEINGQAVQNVLIKFASLLQQKGAKNEIDFQNLWQESVKLAEKDKVSKELKNEIRKLIDCIFQVSTLEKKETLETVE